jgi:hypothetical protein
MHEIVLAAGGGTIVVPQDEAQRQKKNWSVHIMREYQNWVAVQRLPFAIEDFRHYISLRKPELLPSSPNAWGFLGRAGLSLGVVEHVGYRRACSPKTHGHRVMIFGALPDHNHSNQEPGALHCQGDGHYQQDNNERMRDERN